MMFEIGSRISVSRALRPSEYTAALIQVLRSRVDLVSGASTLEIGSGCGVVLATLGALGAASLCGVDIEPEAVSVGSLLLHELGYGNRAELHHGNMWEPVAGRRFDLIVANLPHFPMGPGTFDGRLPTWSSGGSDGRRLLDPFLEGLAVHLAPRGRAFLTHNAFVSPETSHAMLAANGLQMRIASTQLVYIPDTKLDRMTPSVLCAEERRSIHRYGAYTFGEVHIVEVAEPATLG